MDIPLAMQKERITKTTARNWCGRALGLLTKRDQDAFSRISIKLGEAGTIRYFAARYIDPIFVTGEEETAYRAFGEKIEAAYHELLTALRAARAAKFEVQYRGKGWCVVNGHDVRLGPYSDKASANDALKEVRAEILAEGT
jgi:hypothetical protein